MLFEEGESIEQPEECNQQAKPSDASTNQGQVRQLSETGFSRFFEGVLFRNRCIQKGIGGLLVTKALMS